MVTIRTCPICGKDGEHDDFYKPYDKRMKSYLDRACGFRVDQGVFDNICNQCREWCLSLATQNQMDDAKKRILRGETDGEER